MVATQRGRDMTVLAIALEEGFDDDKIVVEVNDRVVFDEEHLSSRYQGVTRMFEVPAEGDDARVAVRVPSRGLAGETAVDLRRGPNLRISVQRDEVRFDA